MPGMLHPKDPRAAHLLYPRLESDTYSVAATAPSAGAIPLFEVEVSKATDGNCGGVSGKTTFLPERPIGFETVRMPDEPGMICFQPHDVNGEHTWDFGDGSPIDTGFQPKHTYAKPGIYEVKRCRPELGSSICGTQLVEIAAPTLTADIVPVNDAGTPLAEDHKFAVDDEVNLRVRTSVDTDGAGSISTIQPAGGEWLKVNAALELIEDPGELPESVDLDAGESFETVLKYRIVQAGSIAASVTVVGVDDADRPVGPVEASWNTRVSGLNVKVTTK